MISHNELGWPNTCHEGLCGLSIGFQFQDMKNANNANNGRDLRHKHKEQLQGGEPDLYPAIRAHIYLLLGPYVRVDDIPQPQGIGLAKHMS